MPAKKGTATLWNQGGVWHFKFPPTIISSILLQSYQYFIQKVIVAYSIALLTHRI